MRKLVCLSDNGSIWEPPDVGSGPNWCLEGPPSGTWGILVDRKLASAGLKLRILKVIPEPSCKNLLWERKVLSRGASHNGVRTLQDNAHWMDVAGRSCTLLWANMPLVMAIETRMPGTLLCRSKKEFSCHPDDNLYIQNSQEPGDSPDGNLFF